PLWWLLWMLARHHLRESMWNRICDAHLLDKMQIHNGGADNLRWLVWPLAIVFTLATIAAAGPGWRPQTHPLMESASARIIALELSRAMMVEDVKPNRFEQAIAATREIIAADFEGETGLVVFSGAAFVVSPLSRDATTLQAFVDALEPGVLPLDGLRVDLAIASAQDLLLASISGQGQIIVITSGIEQHSNALQAALDAGAQGHQVSIMAIGTSAGAPLVDENGSLQMDGQGNFMLAKTDFAGLREIAEAGNGLLISLAESTAYDELLGSRISADNLVEASKQRQDDNRETANDGIWLVWILLPFALLLFRRNLLWVLLIAVLLPLDHGAQAAGQDSIWQHRERDAYNAYQQGDYQRSATLSTSPLLQGAAYFRNGDYQQAVDAFSRDEQPASHYNRGNALARLNHLDDAISAYDQALILDPGFDQARYNKRLLELYLQRLGAGDDEDAADSTENGANPDDPAQSGSENRFEVGPRQMINPADEQRLEAGFGASIQSGQVDPFEKFDGNEQQPGRFILDEDINQSQVEAFVNNWIEGLPAASSELFRRKFLRDYQRQQQQAR
ncbi:MAG: tetratricopeptide repeat protein, partial [Gammaproteobacteria bacterium]|nr:tetratricopeptide repeat protein [Gammaproteobacteria bacterium]